MKGLIANLLTPLVSTSDQLCHPSIVSLLDYLYTENVLNLWVLGSAGEDFALPMDIKMQIYKFFDETILKFDRVLLGISTNNPTDEDFLLSSLCNYNSIHGFHFLCYDQKIGDYQYLKRVENLTTKLEKPLYLYHNPKRGKPLNSSIVNSLSNLPNIGGIKIGGYDFEQMKSFKDAAPHSWNLFCAGGAQIVDCLKIGFQAHSTSDANIFPRLFNSIFSLLSEGNVDQAYQLQHLAHALSKMIPRNQNGEYSAEEKYVLYNRGILKTDSVNITYEKLSESQKLLTSYADEIYMKLFK